MLKQKKDILNVQAPPASVLEDIPADVLRHILFGPITHLIAQDEVYRISISPATSRSVLPSARQVGLRRLRLDDPLTQVLPGR